MKKKLTQGAKAIRRLFSDVKAEFKRTTWPDRRELKKSTIIVMVFIVLLAFSVLVCDRVIQYLLTLIHA